MAPKESSERKHVLEASYSDMEGLLINVGVISALLLSIAIPLFSSLSIDDLLLAEYRSMLLLSLDFRRVVAWELNKIMFDFDVSLGPDITFDVKAALELPRPDNYWLHPTYMETMDNVYHMTRESVPKYIISSGVGNSNTLVANIRRCYVLSVTMFTIVLLTALFLYIAITISGYGEREEDKKDDLKKKVDKLWETFREQKEEDTQHDQNASEPAGDEVNCFESLAWVFTLVVVCAMYITIIAGIIFVFWGFMDVMRLRYPDLALTHALLVNVGMKVGISIIGVSFLISLAVFCSLQLSQRCCSNPIQQTESNGGARAPPEKNLRTATDTANEAGHGSKNLEHFPRQVGNAGEKLLCPLPGQVVDSVEDISCQSLDDVSAAK